MYFTLRSLYNLFYFISKLNFLKYIRFRPVRYIPKIYLPEFYKLHGCLMKFISHPPIHTLSTTKQLINNFNYIYKLFSLYMYEKYMHSYIFYSFTMKLFKQLKKPENLFISIFPLFIILNEKS